MSVPWTPSVDHAFSAGNHIAGTRHIRHVVLFRENIIAWFDPTEAHHWTSQHISNAGEAGKSRYHDPMALCRGWSGAA